MTTSHGVSRIDARKELAGTDQDDTSNREEMIGRFRSLAELLEEPPAESDLDTIYGYSRDDYMSEFGSMFALTVEAGRSSIDPDEFSRKTDGSTKYSEWDLVTELWRLLEKFGEVSVRTMDSAGKYSSQTYRYRFGSWSEALKTAYIEGPTPSVESTREPMEAHYAGKEWQELRTGALKRDNYECQACGKTEEDHQDEFGVGLNVHHIKDIAEHEDPSEADRLENLETLCVECHGKEHPFSTS